MSDRKGLFISIEGNDGAGKSTVARLLKEDLEDLGYDVVLLREPGGLEQSEKIRNIIFDHDINEMTELLLFLAARSEVVDKIIKPALTEGKIVLTDRFHLSTIAYQGFGRGIDLGMIEDWNNTVCGNGGLLPDLNLFLSVSEQEGIRRKKQQGELNRFDTEDGDFHKRVREGYLTYGKGLDNFKVINTEYKSAEDVKREVLRIIKSAYNL